MLRYLNEKLHPAFMRVVAAPGGQLDAALAGMDSALAGLEERLRRLEGARGRGGALTMADAAFATFPERLAVFPALRGVAPRLQDGAAAWAAALLERPEVAATVLPPADHLANLRRYLPQE
jgi:glutathione S-transferase